MTALRPGHGTAPTARHYALAAAAFAAFALYGSLVPLNLRPLSWEEAQHRWGEVCSQPIRVESKSDWAANILLFLPIGFFSMAAFTTDRGRAADWWALPIAAACVGFSALLEFLQLYFPPRVSSIDDVAAESLGGAVGIALWIAIGWRLTRRARAMLSGKEAPGTAAWLVIAYLVLLALAQVTPPDLTISPVELYHKYKAGLVRPAPFAYWAVDPTAAVKKMLEGAAWFLPLGLLLARVPRWASGGRRAAWEVLGVGVATAGAAEFLRLFVVVHSCDATDVVTNGLAVLAGWYVALDVRTKGVRWLAVAIWLAALVYLNWYPFDFHFDAAHAERWRAISWLPFADYLQGAYLASLENAGDKVIQFALLGALAALAFSPRTVGGRLAAVAAAALLAALFEAGQLFLPTRYTSVTDVLVEAGSACLGFWVWGRIARQRRLEPLDVSMGAAGNPYLPARGRFSA